MQQQFKYLLIMLITKKEKPSTINKKIETNMCYVPQTLCLGANVVSKFGVGHVVHSFTMFS